MSHITVGSYPDVSALHTMSSCFAIVRMSNIWPTTQPEVLLSPRSALNAVSGVAEFLKVTRFTPVISQNTRCADFQIKDTSTLLCVDQQATSRSGLTLNPQPHYLPLFFLPLGLDFLAAFFLALWLTALLSENMRLSIGLVFLYWSDRLVFFFVLPFPDAFALAISF